MPRKEHPDKNRQDRRDRQAETSLVIGIRKEKRMAGGIKATFFQNHTKRMRAAQAQRKSFYRLHASGEPEWENGKRFHNDSWD
jgi:hypothetical protein